MLVQPTATQICQLECGLCIFPRVWNIKYTGAVQSINRKIVSFIPTYSNTSMPACICGLYAFPRTRADPWQSESNSKYVYRQSQCLSSSGSYLKLTESSFIITTEFNVILDSSFGFGSLLESKFRRCLGLSIFSKVLTKENVRITEWV